MSCDYCTQTKGALRLAQSSSMSPTQMRLQWAHPGLLLPRCPRGHFVSPRTMTCRPCGNLVLGTPQPWPPHGYYVSMRQAVTDLLSGAGDHLVAEHKRTKPRSITLYVDPASGQLVRAVPDAEMAAPPVVPVPAAAPSTPPPIPLPTTQPGTAAWVEGADDGFSLVAAKIRTGEWRADLDQVPPGVPAAQWNQLGDDGKRALLVGMIERGELQPAVAKNWAQGMVFEPGPAALVRPRLDRGGWANVAIAVQNNEIPVDLTAAPPGMPEARWAKLGENERRTAIAGMIARGELDIGEPAIPTMNVWTTIPGPAAMKCPTCGRFMSATQGCLYCAEQAATPVEVAEQLEADQAAVESAAAAAETMLDTPALPAGEPKDPFAGAGERVARWYSEQRRKKALPSVPAPGMPMLAMANALAGSDQEGIVLTPLTLADLSKEETKANRQGESRWSRAQELIDRLRPTETPGVYEYGGGGGKSPYVIDLNATGPGGQRGTCTCEDCQNVGPSGTRCKHILAAHQRAARDGVVLGARATRSATPPPTTDPATGGLSREEQIRQQIEAITGVSSADLAALEEAGCPPRIPFADPPFIDETFELTPQGEEVLQGMGGVIRYNLAQRRAGREGACSIGIYGPPGTGKNTIARQLAATLGLPFEESDVNKDTDVASLFGGVGIQSKEGATSTYADVSRIGMALEAGAVVCINEVHSLPAETQTLLHQIAQEGRWTIPGPEGKHEVHYVHPESVLVMTWNEQFGMPEDALLSRLVTFEMQHPTEEQERNMLARWAAGSGLPVDSGDIDSTTKLVRGLRTLYEQGNLAKPPSFREMRNFYMMLKTTGNIVLAVRQIRKDLEQTFERASQWASAEPIIKRFFPQFQGLPW